MWHSVKNTGRLQARDNTRLEQLLVMLLLLLERAISPASQGIPNPPPLPEHGLGGGWSSANQLHQWSAAELNTNQQHSLEASAAEQELVEQQHSDVAAVPVNANRHMAAQLAAPASSKSVLHTLAGVCHGCRTL